MRYAPPQMAPATAEDCAGYGGIVSAMYCFYDLFLGRLIQLAGPDATFMILSPAGFRSGKERPVSPDLQALPGAWYRPYGRLAMAGPNMVADELLHGVTVLDVAPTVLAALGLPAALDMPGKIIESAFIEAPPMPRIASAGKTFRETAECRRVRAIPNSAPRPPPWPSFITPGIASPPILR